jgi:hypothetical protein
MEEKGSFESGLSVSRYQKSLNFELRLRLVRKIDHFQPNYYMLDFRVNCDYAGVVLDIVPYQEILAIHDLDFGV